MALKILKWLNEKTIEVPEHGYDWMAPRWYAIMVALAYVIVIISIIWLMEVI